MSPRPYNEITGLGLILSDQIKSLDRRAKAAAYICRSPEETVEEVLSRLNTLIQG